MEWLNIFIKRNVAWITAISCIVVLALPYLLTRRSVTGVYFTDTGQIGDTIAGTTAPFIGLITILLVYLTYSSQKEELKKTRELVEQQAEDSIKNQHVTSIENLTKEILHFIEMIEWKSLTGIRALRNFDPKEKVDHTLPSELQDVLLRFRILFDTCYKLKDELNRVSYLNRSYTLFYSKIVWNVNVNIFKNHADYLMENHDDSTLIIPLYARLSNETVEYLLEQKLVQASVFKDGILEKFNRYSNL